MADDEKSGGGMIAKVVGGVFATLIAPLLVAWGIHYLQPQPDRPPPPGPTQPGPPSPSTPEEPTEKVLLSFNGKDLTGFYTYLEKTGRAKDPKGVFTVKDGLLRVSGEELGYLATEQTYNNYRLIAEYKWGEKTWPPIEDRARRSGIMVHADGADGAVGGSRMVGYECGVTEGKTGALKSWQANQRQLKLTVEVNPKFAKPNKILKMKGPVFVFMPGGQRATLGSAAWVEPLFHDPLNWKNEKGTRARGDVEKPSGDWNTLEIVCGANKASLHFIQVKLNLTRVNLGTQPTLLGGKVLIRSAGAEIFFRKIELVAMKK